MRRAGSRFAARARTFVDSWHRFPGSLPAPWRCHATRCWFFHPCDRPRVLSCHDLCRLGRVPTGFAAGIELCPEFICGFALFAGQFEGQVNSKPANGGFVAAVTHGDLPEFLEVAPITGGQFIITAGRRTFRGDVIGGKL